ncbi:MAG: SBBP repeat-containing protein [Thermodesulfobacteriota bacterium]
MTRLRWYRRIGLLVSAFLVTQLSLATSPASGRVPAAAPAGVITQDSYNRLPLYFIANQGQMKPRVHFYSRIGGGTLVFTRKGVELTAPAIKTGRAATVSLSPVGLSSGTRLVPQEPQAATVNYFIGNDPKKWHTAIPTYGAILYQDAYPGINLKFYGTGKQLEYDIIVRPGADLNRIKFSYEGVQRLEIVPGGDLVIMLPDGKRLFQKKPVVYQKIAGRQVPREGNFRLFRNSSPPTYGFSVAAYDKTIPLIIDPVLVYSTYLGGGQPDIGHSIAVDQVGNVYVTGETQSADFPTLGPIYPYAAAKDVFVTKINAAGTALIYSTFIGGSTPGVGPANPDDIGYGITVNSAGNAYVTGETSSSDFPTKNPLPYTASWWRPQTFVTRINAAGNDLDYSTYFSSYDPSSGRGIALDGTDNAYVTGYANSGLPLLHELYTWQGYKDAFVAKIAFNAISETTSLIYSTYLGGGSEDIGYAIAVDGAGNAFVTGETASSDFPTQSPMYLAQGGKDAFVSKLSYDEVTTSLSLVYSTYLGGEADDLGRGLALDGVGNAYLTGETASSDFPTANPLYLYQGGKDVFVTKINAAGNTLVYSTFLGGSLPGVGMVSPDDVGYGVAVDKTGNAYVTGESGSSDFPTKNPLPYTVSWWRPQTIVAKLNANGDVLRYCTYLSSYDPSSGRGIALYRGSSIAYVTGYASWNFAIHNALYPTCEGYTDAFIAKLREDIVPPRALLLWD